MKRNPMIVLLAVVLCAAVPALADDYYFSAVGNDTTGDGSQSNPWQTIDKLNTLDLNPGDKVYFRAGDMFSGKIMLDVSDSATDPAGTLTGAPVTLSSFGGDTRPVISSPSDHGLHAVDAGGIEVIGLEFSGGGNVTEVSNTTNGLFFENSQSHFRLQHVYIDDVVVHGFGDAGIKVHATNPSTHAGGFQDVRIIHTEVYDTGAQGIFTSVSSDSGMVIDGSTFDYQSRAHADVYVAHNVVHHTTGKAKEGGVSGNGIVLPQVDGAVVERNVAHHNGGVAGGGGVAIWTWEANNVIIQFNEAYRNNAFDGRDGGGFDLDGGVTNSVMQYNYSHANLGAGYGLFQFGYASAMGNNVIRYNISEADGAGIAAWGSGPRFDTSDGSPGTVDDAEASIFYNNTIVNPNGRPAAHLFGSLTDLGIYNNIFVVANGNKLVNLEDWGEIYLHDNMEFLSNVYWSSDEAFIIDWEGMVFDRLEDWANTTGQEMIGPELAGLAVDPELTGPFSGGTPIDDPEQLETLAAYRLQMTSLLIDAGLDVAALDLPISLGLTNVGQRDFFGNRIPSPSGGEYDIGAHEFTLEGE